jgi:murein DD-endopeptidase MepM/ murein hydrolase activator NlpD
MAVLLAAGFASGQHAKKPNKKPNLKELKKQHASKHSQIVKLRNQARVIKNRAGHVRLDIHTLDNQISEHVDRVEQIQARLKTNLKLQISLASDLKVATQRLKVRSMQAMLRIRQMYMHGDSTLASAIVGSDSLAELSSRQFVFERIAQRDRQLFEEVKELQQNVVRKKTEVDRVIVQVRQDEDDEKTAEAELQDERQDKADALDDLKNQEGQIEVLLKELDKEDEETMSEIQAFEGGSVGRSMPAFHGRFGLPVYGARLSSGFGMRYHPILHRMRMHTGQDFAAPGGTPIHAAADGIVVSTRWSRGYGNLVVVEHGGGYSTLYGHCLSFVAHPGQHVRRGEVIARVGKTGLATGYHCHFEIRIGGKPVNPMPFLRG